MSYRTFAAIAAAALIAGAASVPNEALAYRGGVRAGGVYHGGAYRGGVYHGGGYAYRGRYVRPGVAVGAAAVGAAAVGAAAAGPYYNSYNNNQRCGYYPYPACY